MELLLSDYFKAIRRAAQDFYQEHIKSLKASVYRTLVNETFAVSAETYDLWANAWLLILTMYAWMMKFSLESFPTAAQISTTVYIVYILRSILNIPLS